MTILLTIYLIPQLMDSFLVFEADENGENVEFVVGFDSHAHMKCDTGMERYEGVARWRTYGRFGKHRTRGRSFVRFCPILWILVTSNTSNAW